MVSSLLLCITLGTALGAGVVAGVFFAFSSFVLPALARLPQGLGLSAMQSVNGVVMKSTFLRVFVATGLACGGLATEALLQGSAPGARLRLAGSLLYLTGSLLVTGARNVPWNEALDALSVDGPAAARTWASFVASWGFWNRVRTAASFVSAALLVLSLTPLSR